MTIERDYLLWSLSNEDIHMIPILNGQLGTRIDKVDQ